MLYLPIFKKVMAAISKPNLPFTLMNFNEVLSFMNKSENKVYNHQWRITSCEACRLSKIRGL